MTKNPFINALSAVLYIALVATIMFYGPEKLGPAKSIVIPIAILCLFSLSAAMMGYIFLFQPVQMYLDGKKKEAVNLFVKTLATFAGITLLVFILLFSRILPV